MGNMNTSSNPNAVYINSADDQVVITQSTEHIELKIIEEYDK